MFRIAHFRSRSLAVAIGLIAAGCAKAVDTTTDSAGATASVAPSANAGMAPGAMDQTAQAGTNRAPARDGDHEFLRMMSDHHEGLVQMAMAAMTRASTPAAQGDAHTLHTKQADEQRQMLAMVQTAYGETVAPMVMPSNKAMNDSLQTKTGPEYDRTFYANVIAHHREGIRMVDDMQPKLARPEVRQMAQRMKADQQKEIAEFQRKIR